MITVYNDNIIPTVPEEQGTCENQGIKQVKMKKHQSDITKVLQEIREIELQS